MYRALISFSGAITMAKGETREITDPAIVKDLTRAGYIEPVTPAVEAKQPKQAPAKSAKKK